MSFVLQFCYVILSVGLAETGLLCDPKAELKSVYDSHDRTAVNGYAGMRLIKYV